jgi:hypothetical protein
MGGKNILVMKRQNIYVHSLNSLRAIVSLRYMSGKEAIILKEMYYFPQTYRSTKRTQDGLQRKPCSLPLVLTVDMFIQNTPLLACY